MRQQHTMPSGKSISIEVDYSAPVSEQAGVQRRTRRNIIFAAEKFLLARMLHAIGNPPVQLVLWNGQVISNHVGTVAARVLICDRGALFKLLTDPELYFGELYSSQRIA